MAIKHTFIFKDGTKTKTLTAIKAIRQKCGECSNWSDTEIRECPCIDCALYPFRFGKDPSREKRVLSDDQRKELAERLKLARENAQK